MVELRRLKHNTLAKPENETEYLSNNYRPIQPRNGRSIYASFSTAGAIKSSLSLVGLALPVIALFKGIL